MKNIVLKMLTFVCKPGIGLFMNGIERLMFETIKYD